MLKPIGDIPNLNPNRVKSYVEEHSLTDVEGDIMEELLEFTNSIDSDVILSLHKRVQDSEGVKVLLGHMEKFKQQHFIEGNKDTQTMGQYIATLRENGIPWILEK